jgi:hypothetical protein
MLAMGLKYLGFPGEEVRPKNSGTFTVSRGAIIVSIRG